MLLLAATTLEKLQQVPTSTWLKIFGGFILLLIVIFVVRKIFEKVNKFVLFTIVFVVVMVIWLTQLGEQNIFDRWATPDKADPEQAGKPPLPQRK